MENEKCKMHLFTSLTRGRSFKKNSWGSAETPHLVKRVQAGQPEFGFPSTHITASHGLCNSSPGGWGLGAVKTGRLLVVLVQMA